MTIMGLLEEQKKMALPASIREVQTFYVRHEATMVYSHDRQHTYLLYMLFGLHSSTL